MIKSGPEGDYIEYVYSICGAVRSGGVVIDRFVYRNNE